MTVLRGHFTEICNANKAIYMRHLILILCMTIATVLMTATATIALPACPSDPTKRYHNCFGTYVTLRGDIYVGEYKDDVLHGYAGQYRADGSILREGIFKNDEFLYAQN